MRQSQKMERAVAQRDLLLRVSDWTRMVNQENEGAYDHFVVGLHDYENANALTQMHVDKHLSEFVFIAEAALNMLHFTLLALVRAPCAAANGTHTGPRDCAATTSGNRAD